MAMRAEKICSKDTQTQKRYTTSMVRSFAGKVKIVDTPLEQKKGTLDERKVICSRAAIKTKTELCMDAMDGEK